MSNHTPRNWVVITGAVYVKGHGPDDDTPIRIAAMDRNCPVTTPTERDANARFIAKSPEMLQTIKDLLSSMELSEEFSDGTNADMQEAYNLLAEIEGEN